MKGDLNRDGTRDVTDVSMIVNILLGFQKPTQERLWAADINDDGRIDVLDLVALIQAILGDEG